MLFYLSKLSKKEEGILHYLSLCHIDKHGRYTKPVQYESLLDLYLIRQNNSQPLPSLVFVFCFPFFGKAGTTFLEVKLLCVVKSHNFAWCHTSIYIPKSDGDLS